MYVKDLIKKRRTVRKFCQRKIPEKLLISYIESARLAPSGANMQPLKYMLIHNQQCVEELLQHVKWAAYLKGFYLPDANEIPTAFIAVFKDKTVASSTAEFDAGAAVMSMNLAAEEDGVGCCIMGAIDRTEICRILGAADNLELLYMVALGYKKEHPVCSELEHNDVKYFLDGETLTVPKRKLSEVLINII